MQVDKQATGSSPTPIKTDSPAPDRARIEIGGWCIDVSCGGSGTPAQGPGVPTITRAGYGTRIDDAGNFTTKVDSEQSGGACFIFEAVMAPGTGVQLHLHKPQVEIFYVVEGEFAVELGDKTVRMGRGAMACIPHNTPHGMHCVADTPSKALFTVIPGGLEQFFYRTRNMTDPKQILALADEYGMKFLGPNYVINSIGMKLVQVPPGEFLMGSPDSDKDANADEKPQHRVRITRPLLMGMHQVTVGQFRQFVEATGYVTEGEASGTGSIGLDLATGRVAPKPEYTWHNPSIPQNEHHPVVAVSWEDARAFCRWLSEKEKQRYRLPTEAEWEYACRAGTTTRFYCGDDEDGLRDVANIGDASLHDRWVWRADNTTFPMGTHLPPWAKPWDDGYPFTAPVGRFAPNAFGLYDMHGNVGEWCSDWYDPKYYEESPEEDPQGPDEGVEVPVDIPNTPPRTLRVLRGGVWLDPAKGCRSADRRTHHRHPVDSAADIGFRVVREM